MDDGRSAANAVSLIMTARYHGDDKVRLDAGTSLVGVYTDAGDYKGLMVLANDTALLPAVCELARNSIVGAAKHDGHDALHEVATRSNLSASMRIQAASELSGDYFVERDFAGLMRLASDERVPHDIRVTAAMHVMQDHAGSRQFGALLDFVKNPKLPYDARRNASEALMELAEADNNYPIILRLSAEKEVPVNIRMAADAMAESVVQSAIEDARSRGDGAMLADMATDKRLPEALRGRAADLAQSLGGQCSLMPKPTVEMVADALALSRARPPLAAKPSSPPTTPTKASFQPPKLNR